MTLEADVEEQLGDGTAVVTETWDTFKRESAAATLRAIADVLEAHPGLELAAIKLDRWDEDDMTAADPRVMVQFEMVYQIN